MIFKNNATCLYQEIGDNRFAFNINIFDDILMMAKSKPLQHLLKSDKHPQTSENNIA